MASLDTDRFSVVAPMKPSAVDDTESGLAVTSAIIEHAMKKRPVLDAAQELTAAPLIYSKLNHVAIEKARSKEAPSVPSSSARRASCAITARRPSQHAESEAASVVHLGANEPDGGVEEPTVLVSFRTNVPLLGKTCFTIPHRMSEPIAALRRNIIAAMATKPTGEVTIHRSDTGAVLPLQETLLDCGFRFPPLLRLTGFHHEMHLTCAAPLGVRIPVPWAPSMTLTDLLQHVQKRLAPLDLRHTRLSTASTAAASGTASDGAVLGRRYLDIQRCFVPSPPQFVDSRRTLHDMGFCATVDDPVCLTWLRSKEGCPLFFTMPYSGEWTVGEVSAHLGALTTSASIDDNGIADYLWGATAVVGATGTMTAMEVLQNATPFDDEDEEVFFVGRDGVQAAAEAKGGDDQDTPPRGLFLWTHAEVDRVHGAGCAAQFGVVVSFCPPPSAIATARPPLRFVPIEEDFLIPHLTDVAIFPGAEVLVEFYDPMTRRWSGDVSQAVSALLNQPPPSGGSSAWARRTSHFNTGDASSDSSPFPKHELLTIRSVDSTAIVRVPCTPTCSIETIQWLYFMCTGYLPMFNVLMADNGRLLCPFESMASANLLPQTTLFSAHRPCAWLNETLPDLSRLGVASTARLFSTTESPNL